MDNSKKWIKVQYKLLQEASHLVFGEYPRWHLEAYGISHYFLVYKR